MRLITQPNNYTCLPVSLVMLLNHELDADITLNDIIKFCGHDGSEIVEPENPPPYCYKGIHVRELQDYCLCEWHRVLAFVEAVPLIENRFPVTPKLSIEDWLKKKSAVICGGMWDRDHAVTWCWSDKMIYDPTGTKYPLSSVNIKYYGIFVL